MKKQSRLSIRFFEALAGLLLAGTVLAVNYPSGQVTGVTPEHSDALVTLALPAVIGVNVGHNFVLDFTPTTGCWGTNGSGTYPQASGDVDTTYNFAVFTTVTAGGSRVACDSAGAAPDLATVQVFSTAGTNSHLTVELADGGSGPGGTTFTAMIADIFSAGRLSVATSDACGGGTPTSPHALTVAAGNYVATIPHTGWANCRQTMSLKLHSDTAVTGGLAATGILKFTIINP